jgi:hypothetical protein
VVLHPGEALLLDREDGHAVAEEDRGRVVGRVESEDVDGHGGVAS